MLALPISCRLPTLKSYMYRNQPHSLLPRDDRLSSRSSLPPPVTNLHKLPPAKKQGKWSDEENALLIKLRGKNMIWNDVARHLPGRSANSCRLRYQNYLERCGEWDKNQKNKLACLYSRSVLPLPHGKLIFCGSSTQQQAHMAFHGWSK